MIVFHTKRIHWDTVGVCLYKATSGKQTHFFYFKLSSSRMVIIVRKSACGASQCYLFSELLQRKVELQEVLYMNTGKCSQCY